MTASRELVAGLETLHVTVGNDPRIVVILLHGYAMDASDFAPFARSIGISSEFYFPSGPCTALPNARAWWPIDQERRATALVHGPRDLFEEHPKGLESARSVLAEHVGEITNRHLDVPVVLAGFSQGGMLACDAVLHGAVSPAGLMLLSSSRIAFDAWEPLADRLHGLPVLISHGRRDADLSFEAGEALRTFCERGRAKVTWIPFETGHEVPLVVWRGVRRYLGALR